MSFLTSLLIDVVEGGAIAAGVHAVQRFTAPSPAEYERAEREWKEREKRAGMISEPDKERND